MSTTSGTQPSDQGYRVRYTGIPEWPAVVWNQQDVDDEDRISSNVPVLPSHEGKSSGEEEKMGTDTTDLVDWTDRVVQEYLEVREDDDDLHLCNNAAFNSTPKGENGLPITVQYLTNLSQKLDKKYARGGHKLLRNFLRDIRRKSDRHIVSQAAQ
jgi:hypothetical protein